MTTKQAFSTLIAIVFFVFNSSIVNCQTSKYNYSVKDRWVLKTSASLHKTPSVNDYFTS
ncbi:MAG: hypothetical protein GX879_08720, partial [Bacteroidales bacterium]|nr:hypothetical protein [Bacteroidales bacterium]